jgi:enamine deaminase RidA (YjgF/YER057c/UK114 family)
MLKILLAIITLSIYVMDTTPARAADIARVSAGAFPISSLVIVPPGSALIYISGTTAEPPSPGAPLGDTKVQTVSALKRVQELLKDHGAGLGDIVMMRVFLVGDPALGGKMDFAGMMAGYSQFFGTPDQPNKPSRTTVQVAGLAAPGAMVEIEAQAAKVKP